MCISITSSRYRPTRLPGYCVGLSLLISLVQLVALSDFAGAEDGDELFVAVLGVAQDAGYPQIGCEKTCCRLAWGDPSERKFVSCVAVVDKISGQRFIFDCTPDFKQQLQLLNQLTEGKPKNLIDGIFLTHGHIGHYTGLVHLGKEAFGANGVPVYGTPRMNQFLTTNGPWSQLVKLNNIELKSLETDKAVKLNERLTVTAFQVPHRDEFTDTVGFKIASKTKSVVYLPDIDKWSKWSRSVEDVIRDTDVALLDGSFFADGELPNRDMASIPHPFIEESIGRFASLEPELRKRIRFIHLNHTNPAIQNNGDPKVNAAARQIEQAGMGLAKQGSTISLNR